MKGKGDGRERKGRKGGKGKGKEGKVHPPNSLAVDATDCTCTTVKTALCGLRRAVNI